MFILILVRFGLLGCHLLGKSYLKLVIKFSDFLQYVLLLIIIFMVCLNKEHFRIVSLCGYTLTNINFILYQINFSYMHIKVANMIGLVCSEQTSD